MCQRRPRSPYRNLCRTESLLRRGLGRDLRRVVGGSGHLGSRGLGRWSIASRVPPTRLFCRVLRRSRSPRTLHGLTNRNLTDYLLVPLFCPRTVDGSSRVVSETLGLVWGHSDRDGVGPRLRDGERRYGLQQTETNVRRPLTPPQSEGDSVVNLSRRNKLDSSWGSRVKTRVSCLEVGRFRVGPTRTQLVDDLRRRMTAVYCRTRGEGP